MSPVAATMPIDVIIPVYKGFEAVKRCLESVLRFDQATSWSLIIVDDATPEPAVREYLAGLAAPHLTLLTNDRNLGFVDSVNRAATLHPDRDFVILNADTEVNGSWLDRLVHCAAHHPEAATITPFSNNGSIAGFPRPGVVNPLPQATSMGDLDALFAHANPGQAVEIPVGVGFCLFVRREAWQEIGGFDRVFGRGYGEEVDFCMAAAARGWHHLLAADVFVFHQGSVSFGQEDVPLLQRKAQDVIDQRYPDFGERVSDWYERDPAANARFRVLMSLVSQSTLPRVLMISHCWGGGVDRHVRELAEALWRDQVAQPFLFQPCPDTGGMAARLALLTDGEVELARGALVDCEAQWRDLLSQFGFASIHLHHIADFPAWILDLPTQLGLPCDVTIHDLWPFCPQFHCLTPAGDYCGKTARGRCVQCVAERPDQWNVGIDAWRESTERFLISARSVVCPSTATADLLLEYFPELPLQVAPHPTSPDATLDVIQEAPAVRKVAILGSLSRAKGLLIVEAVIHRAFATSAPIHFTVIGATERALDVPAGANVTITGSYEESALPSLLAAHRVDGFWFASVVPETFGYTLSTAMAAGLPIVAFNQGAYPERLAGYGAAELLELGASSDEIVSALQRIHPRYHIEPRALAQLPPRVTWADYVAAYAARLGTTPPAAIDVDSLFALVGRLPAVNSTTPASGIAADTLWELAIDCGQATARSHLRARFLESDYDLRRLREQHRRDEVELDQLLGTIDQLKTAHERHAGELIGRIQEQLQVLDARDREIQAAMSEVARVSDEATQVARELGRQIDGLTARVREFETSTFWRMTAPLRVVVQHAKNGIRELARLSKTGQRLLAFARYHRQLNGWSGLAKAVHRRFLRAATLSSEQDGTGRGKHIEIAVDCDGPVILETSLQPVISIVIPSFGQHKVTKHCLASIACYPPSAPYEVIVADDAYVDPFDAEELQISGARVLRQTDNLGFLKNCNAAVREAQGEFVLLLNNDTKLHAGAVDALIQTFGDSPMVGAVGAKLLNEDGSLQEAGGIVWRDGSAWNWGRFLGPEDPRFDYVRAVDYCSAAALMVRKSAWEAVAGFDERFCPAYYEDTDLCFSLRAAGYRVLYQPAARVTHYEGVSHGTDISSGMKSQQDVNQHVFAQKWQQRLMSHRENAAQPDLERDRDARCRILWVEACVLTPDQDSGSLRTLRLLQILRQSGCKVTFMADNLLRDEPYVSQLQQQGIEVIYAPFYRTTESYLRDCGAQFDIFVLCRHYIAIKYIDLVKSLYPAASVWFDTIDLHYLRLRRQFALDGRDATRALADLAYAEELEVIKKADVTLVVSAIEVAELAKEVPQAKVEILSNIHSSQSDIPGRSGRQHLMFVGGFQHPPNVDAVEYFAQSIWPLVKSRHPDTKAFIIGSKMPSRLKELGEAAGLDMVGFVEDLEPYYRSCAVALAPLRYGAGVKGKVNQALSFGLPVVGSTMAFEGMSVEDGKDVMIADDAALFAEAICKVLDDEQLWETLSGNGRDSLQKEFSVDVAKQTLVRLLPAKMPRDG